MSSDFSAAARALLLPVNREYEALYLQIIGAHLDHLGIAAADHAAWLNLELHRWREVGTASLELINLVKAALRPAQDRPNFILGLAHADLAARWAEISTTGAERYFSTHKALTTRFLLDHDFARQLLGQMGWMARLAVVDRMSASEISRVLSARDSRLFQRWDLVQFILRALGLAPSISVQDVTTIFEEDGLGDADLFGDLDIPGAIRLVAQAAKRIGCSKDFETWLTDLLVLDCHEPYLLILHYQMIIQAYFDHPPSYAYEFTPRGRAVSWLNQRYIEAGLPVAQNAFLNNAKATLRFDAGWVAGRADHARAARALAELLASMEALGPLAKAEIASWLRSLLRRFIRLQEQHAGPLPHALPPLDADRVGRLLEVTSVGNTATTGIVEQRIVDILGALRHPREEGWSPRGVGDSVFAPNLPRRKCGDCEFELVVQPQPMIRAYEAHGGRLSLPYVEDHLTSLTQILRQRCEDLAAVTPLENWDIEITFISHGRAGNLPTETIVTTPSGDAAINLAYLSFGEVRDELSAHPNIIEAANRFLSAPLNSPFVHPRIRERVQEILAH